MITRSKLLIGVIAVGAFAFSPLANARGHGGGGGGGTHFQGNHSGSFNRGGSFNRDSNFHRGGGFNRSGGFHRGAGFNRSGSFGRAGHHHRHHGRFCRNGVIFFDPFYYGYGFGYPYGYGYGYGYSGYDSYYSQPYYDEGAYAEEDYSAEIDVQAALADRGYYRGRIDGVIGTETRRAVRMFQRDAGLPVTGRIDRRLLNALRAS